MWKTLFLWGGLGFFLAAWEHVLRSFLIPPLFFVMPVIPVAVFSIIRGRRLEVLVLLLTAGVFADVFSLQDVHFESIAAGVLFFFLVLFADFIMTNHSMYSALALGIVARLTSLVFALPAAVSIDGWSAFSQVFQFSRLWPMMVWDVLILIGFFAAESAFRRLFLRSRDVRPSYGT